MSCGCYNKEILKSGICGIRHGKHNTRIYRIWKGIHNRCNTKNLKDKNYKWYKDISYCPEWEKFEPFYEWAIANGYKNNLTIDRIDNTKGYSPENCRWVNLTTQANNKRNTRYVTCEGVTKPLSVWSRELGFFKSTFYRRIEKGQSEEDFIKSYMT